MKRLLTILLTFTLLLSMLGCSDISTTYTEKDTYTPGEMIKIYDKETDALLGEVTITNIRIIRDEPYFSKEHHGSVENLSEADKKKYGDLLIIEGDDVYLLNEHEAVVQIDYKANVLDSSNKISSSNFSIEDSEDNWVDWDIDVETNLISTSDNNLVVGIKKKGDLNISFSFHRHQESSCEIVCKFDEATNSYVISKVVSSSSFCKSCNKAIDASDNYCRYCGKKQK